MVPSNIPHGKGDLEDRTGDRNSQSKFGLQIAAKPLQRAKQTAYSNLAMAYPTVPWLIAYEFLFPEPQINAEFLIQSPLTVLVKRIFFMLGLVTDVIYDITGQSVISA